MNTIPETRLLHAQANKRGFLPIHVMPYSTLIV